jgi:hypothetical protein
MYSIQYSIDGDTFTTDIKKASFLRDFIKAEAKRALIYNVLLFHWEKDEMSNAYRLEKVEMLDVDKLN